MLGLKIAEILLAESCRKQVSFESGFNPSVEEFLRPDGREFQTEGARKLKERSSERFGVALWDFQELLTR